MSDWPRFWTMNVPADPAAPAADPMTMPGNVTCKGVIEMKGFALMDTPVSEIPCCVEYPVWPLVV
jgi:hypothetical protein